MRQVDIIGFGVMVGAKIKGLNIFFWLKNEYKYSEDFACHYLNIFVNK